MTVQRIISCLLIASTAIAPRPILGQAPPRLQVIDNVTLIDGTGLPMVPDAVVVVRDGRIIAAGPRRFVSVPGGATRIDGGGGYLLPGLIDMHAHVTLGPVGIDREASPPALVALPDSQVTPRTLAALVAAGITTARDPGGVAERTVAARKAVEQGKLAGPRLVVAGDVIDHTDFKGLTAYVSTPEEVRVEVRRQKELGVDFIKLYATLTPELLAAGVQEAHRLGVPAVAHVMQTTWTEAAEAGLDGIVHILGWSGELLPIANRQAYQDMMAGTQFMYGWLELMDLEGAELNEAIDAMARYGMNLDPTLVVFERAIRGNEPTVIQSPHLQDAAPALVQNWRTLFNFNLGWTPDDYRRAALAWPKALQLTHRLWERGVLLTAGTDANNPWTVPGESYHRELELLVDAGIPPLEVLSIATRNGARVLGLLDELGTVEVGKRADLVLIRGNPLERISATRDVVWVMQGGWRRDPARIREGAGLSGSVPIPAAR